MRQSSTVGPPAWVKYAVSLRAQEDVSFQQLARLIGDRHGVDVEWHQVRYAVNKWQHQILPGPLPPPPPALLPWVLPADETDAFVAPRLRLLVASHRGHKLKDWEQKRVQSLLDWMHRFGKAEVIRWDGVSWELRRRRETDQVFDPTWFPPLIVR